MTKATFATEDRTPEELCNHVAQVRLTTIRAVYFKNEG
jgi:hypothetical protein